MVRRSLKVLSLLFAATVVIAACSTTEIESDSRSACAEYSRAFQEDQELDNAGANVVMALDNPRITDIQNRLFRQEESLNNKYPGWGELILAADSTSIEQRFGSVGSQEIEQFADTFRELHEAITAECDSLPPVATSSKNSPTAGGRTSETSAGNMTTPSTSMAPALFLLDPPMLWGFCYAMDLPVCSTDAHRQSTLKLGYRLPPPDGIPLSTNRDENFWMALSKTEKNDYLSVTLWDWAARLGVSGGNQSLDESQIEAEYNYMLEWSVWFVNALSSGAEPTAVLEQMRNGLTELDDMQWLVDYRINMVRWVALPALGPQFISEVDEVIVDRS
jgi:hypothetical protein